MLPSKLILLVINSADINFLSYTASLRVKHFLTKKGILYRLLVAIIDSTASSSSFNLSMFLNIEHLFSQDWTRSLPSSSPSSDFKLSLSMILSSTSFGLKLGFVLNKEIILN